MRSILLVISTLLPVASYIDRRVSSPPGDIDRVRLITFRDCLISAMGLLEERLSPLSILMPRCFDQEPFV